MELDGRLWSEHLGALSSRLDLRFASSCGDGGVMSFFGGVVKIDERSCIVRSSLENKWKLLEETLELDSLHAQLFAPFTQERERFWTNS